MLVLLHKREVLTWLEDFVLQLGDDLGHKGRVRVGEEGNRGHQRPTVIVYHILRHYSNALK